MTIKVDGTNGVLQAYDYQTPTTGFSYTFAAGTQTLIMNPAGTLATGTITMPASPADGMTITIESTQQITALTVQGNTGQSFVGGSMTLRANQPVSFVYRLTNTTWYPFSGATNSDIVSGTSQASTSGTSIDFTSIPSWVKRITVMFNAVSLSGTSYPVIQAGAGSITTTGYVASSTLFSVGGINSSRQTTFFAINPLNNAATDTYYGALTLSSFGSNQWVATGIFNTGSGTDLAMFVSGVVSLSGTLDRVRITTGNGTDTFDAGSINILYE